MSDFLSRLAARAVGESAAVRPRTPGLFEEPGAAADATLEIVDEQVVAPRPGPVRDDGHAEPSNARAASPFAPTRAVAESVTATPGAEAAPSAPRPHQIAGAPPAISGAGRDERRPEPVGARRRDPVAVTASDLQGRPVASAAVRVTPAAPATAAAREPAFGARAAVARHDEPAVRVHIGRLEVRANLHQPASEQPRREAPRAEGLSLADYLRGEREVG